MLQTLAALAVVLLVACVPDAAVRPLVSVAPVSPVTVIKDANVFVGSDNSTLLLHHDVILRGAVIEQVVPTGGALPAQAHVVEAAGKTLLPGFVDAHVHMASTGAPPWQKVNVPPGHNLAAYLYSGVTTVYDLTGVASQLHELRRDLEADRLVGPQLFFAGPGITAPGGHPIVLLKAGLPFPLSLGVDFVVPQPSTPAEAKKAVDTIVDSDVDFIKVVIDHMPHVAPSLDQARVEAVVQAAHAHGKKVFAHIGSEADALLAVRAGCDVLAHGPYRGGISAEAAAEIAKAKVPVIFTYVVWQSVADLVDGTWQATPLDTATVPSDVLRAWQDRQHHNISEAGELGTVAQEIHADRAHWQPAVQRLYEAGVKLVVGTDSPLATNFPGPSLHDEMALLVKAGVPPGEVLLGATSRAAQLFLPKPGFGTIQPGMQADLVLVDGDPLTDINATRQLVAVWQRGRVVTRQMP